jgi:hypothetical protein
MLVSFPARKVKQPVFIGRPERTRGKRAGKHAGEIREKNLQILLWLRKIYISNATE